MSFGQLVALMDKTGFSAKFQYRVCDSVREFWLRDADKKSFQYPPTSNYQADLTSIFLKHYEDLTELEKIIFKVNL